MFRFNASPIFSRWCSTPLAAAVVSAAINSTPVLAMVSADSVEQTLVSATRTEQTLATTMSPTTIITRADIERIQPLDVMQLLERVPGISFSRNGGYGSATSLMMRGNNAGHTLVLVDGIRIASATLGSASLEHINPALIERIEVVRGPRSSLYGSDAIGGVVNIITRRPRGELQPSIKAGIGNHGIRQSEVFIGGGDERLSVGMTAAHFYTTGTDHTTHKDYGRGDDDAFRETSLGFTIHHRPTDWLQADLHYQNNHAESEHDTQCLDSSTYASISCTPFTRSRVDALGARLIVTPVTGWNSTLRVGRATDDYKEHAEDIDISQTTAAGQFKTRRTQYSWQNDLSMIDGHILTLGYDFEREEVSSSTIYDKRRRDNDGYFVQLQSQWGTIVDTVVGYRKDDNEQFGNYETSNVAAGVELPAEFKVVASYSEGFKAPTFNDLYYPNYGNPNWVPETSKNYELELRGNHFGVSWSLSNFRNNVKNLIQYNPATFGTDQVSRARITGTELAAETVIADWMISFSATLLDPEARATGNYLPRRARKFANLEIDRQFGSYQLGMGIRAEGTRYNNPENTIKLPGYGKVNLRLGYTVNSEWQVKLKLDNLFNKNIRLAADSSQHYYRQPGFEAILAVIYTPQ